MRLEPSESKVTRRNGERVNTVQAFLMPGILPAVALAESMAVLDASGYAPPQGIRLETGGDSDARNSTVQALIAPLGLIITLSIAVVAMTFNSFRLTLIAFTVAGLLSRAKDSCLVFGDMDILATARSGSPRALLSEFLAAKGKALDFAMEPREDLTRGDAQIEMLQHAAEHDAFLLAALKGEGRRYMIVSPWVVAGTIERTVLLDAMATARQRGAEIEVFTDPLLNNGAAAGGLSQMEAVEHRLSAIGVAVHQIPKLHSKIVTVDGTVLCAGSFNWLSADRNGQYARHETSFVYRGRHLEDEIKTIHDGLMRRAK